MRQTVLYLLAAARFAKLAKSRRTTAPSPAFRPNRYSRRWFVPPETPSAATTGGPALVNLRSVNSVGQYFRAVEITATCREVLGGVEVEMRAQTRTHEFFPGRYRDEIMRRYWDNIDHELGR